MRGITLLAAGALLFAATSAQAASLFVFGDSLVDSGNVDARLRAAGQPTRTPPAAGYFEGRFSNGYNFADQVAMAISGQPATAYGVPGTAFDYGGSNFSFGGAQAREVAGDASPSFAEQIALFQSSGQTFGADDLVLLTFGGNDIQQELLRVVANPFYTPNFAATNLALSTGIDALVAAGAQRIVVTGQADIGQIPRITEFGSSQLNALGTGLSITLNEAFRNETVLASARTGADVQFFDLLAFQAGLLADPAASGYTNITQPCLNETTGTLANPTCQGYLYFDRIHPTALAHQQIAAGILAQVNGAVPEPATWAMMILGFGLVGATARRRRAAIA